MDAARRVGAGVIRRSDIRAGAAGTVPATSATVPLQWPLVGRHEELDLFAATLGDPRAHGFVIYGAAGVGKTRLADQCLALADGQGRNVARATAIEGSRSIPLGALAHLLPSGIGDERCDLVTVMSEVRPVLLAQALNGPLVLFVDDLQLLDTTSATFIGQLVDADLVFLVATVRADEPLPAGLESLWHRARVRRIDLDDLDRAAVDTLLHLVLRGPVEANTITEIWTASRGNVLFVRELVLGAVDGGLLVFQHGVWRLIGALVTTPRLRELVATRLGALEPAAADALDRLAVWEPTGLSALEAVVGGGCLEVLDRCRAAGRARRGPPADRVAGPPAVRRDPARPDAGADPPAPAARARRSHRRAGRPPARGHHPVGDRPPRGVRVGRPATARPGRSPGSVRPRLRQRRAARARRAA